MNVLALSWDEASKLGKLDEYLAVRRAALAAGRIQWGCAGWHSGTGHPDCPLEPHHHHDIFCDIPTDLECRMAGTMKPYRGWQSR